jgi:hypothetical protein
MPASTQVIVQCARERECGIQIKPGNYAAHSAYLTLALEKHLPRLPTLNRLGRIHPVRALGAGCWTRGAILRARGAVPARTGR